MASGGLPRLLEGSSSVALPLEGGAGGSVRGSGSSHGVAGLVRSPPRAPGAMRERVGGIRSGPAGVV